MIVILGGTSETRPIAATGRLLGHEVLVCTATDADLDVAEDMGVERRCGRLDVSQLAALLREKNAKSIIDATHPYAVAASETARKAAALVGVPYHRYRRPETQDLPGDIIRVADHQAAAEVASAQGGPVLLTTGSRNLEPYVQACAQSGVPLFARILDNNESLAAAKKAGLLPRQLIVGRGPFDAATNGLHLAETQAKVLVTKDGGGAAAMREKCEVAAHLGCTIVLITRPQE